MSNLPVRRHNLGYVTPSVMSVGQIQHEQELFDEDDEVYSVDAAAAGDPDATAAVSNDDLKVHNNEVQTINSRLCCSSMYRDVLTMVLLTAVNLLNYMDRFSVAGQFPD